MFPKPTNVTELKKFLGLSSYFRKFVGRYAIISEPLRNLLRKDKKFQWETPQQDAFEELRKNKAYKYNLSHLGKNKPILFASRSLSDTELNYATKYYRPYLYGQSFMIITNHKPLTWLMSFKEPNSKLVRWKLQLLEFDLR